MSRPATHYVVNDSGLIFGQCADDDDEAPFVADVIGDRERAAFGMLTDQEAATASFIVTACNAHAAFLEALTSIKMLSEARGDNRRQQVALFDCHCLAVNALATLASDEVQA